MISSSMIVNGLSWWQSWLCVWIGYTISGTFICMTGRIGATYHISFPVVSRASFGIWGSLWPVFNRAAMACIWYGVQSWIGGGFPLIIMEADRYTDRFARRMRHTHAPLYMDQLYTSTKQHASQLRHKYSRFPQLLPVLGLQFASNLVSSPSNPSPLHSQGLLCACSRCSLLHLGHCQGSWYWTHCAPTSKGSRKCSGLGHGIRHYVFDSELRNTDSKRL